MATITGLYRYAVKSLAGEALDSAGLGPHGLAGDRRYAFLDSAANRAGRPLTARQLDALLNYSSRLEGDRVVVTTPGGRSLEVESAELRRELETLLGRPLALRDAAGRNFDDSPLLVLNLASVQRLGERLGRHLDPRRFRPNILLEGLEADAEYAWVGRRLRAGTSTLEGSLMCERCVMITIDPDSLERDPAILRELAENRQSLMGLYCRVVEPGSVVLGDAVEAGEGNPVATP